MLTLYILFSLMLGGALCLLFLPSRQTTGGLLSSGNLIITLLTITFSFGLYFLFSNTSALAQWLKHGQEHYQLLVEYERLGGIDGIILKIKQKLAKDPSDAQGWMILGKLYQSKHDDQSAKKAFDHVNRTQIQANAA